MSGERLMQYNIQMLQDNFEHFNPARLMQCVRSKGK